MLFRSMFQIAGHGLSFGRDAVQKYLAQFSAPPEAIIAPNDQTALGIIAELKNRGFRVPEDVSVAGFDNIEIGAYFDPPLTSIGFDNGTFADKVWELMKTRLENPAQPVRRAELHQELIIRRSCR